MNREKGCWNCKHNDEQYDLNYAECKKESDMTEEEWKTYFLQEKNECPYWTENEWE